MSRDYSKKSYAMKKTPRQSGRRSIVWIIVAAVCMVGVGYGVYKYKNKTQSSHSSFIASSLSRMATWISARKSHLHSGIVKVKQMATNEEEAAPEIHFEFYTSLPNMRPNVAEAHASEANKPVVETTVKKTAMKKSIVSAEELEREFSSQFEK